MASTDIAKQSKSLNSARNGTDSESESVLLSPLSGKVTIFLGQGIILIVIICEACRLVL